MTVKIKPKIAGCVLCIVIIAILVPRVSASSRVSTWQNTAISSGVEQDINFTFAAGDQVQISIRVDGGMLVRFVLMNASQFINWTNNRAFTELVGAWIYNDAAIGQEDRIYQVPANGIYYIVFVNNNGNNITVHYEVFVQQPLSIAGAPIMLQITTIVLTMVVIISKFLRSSHKIGQLHQ